MTGHLKAPGSHPFLAWFLLIILSLVWGSSFILIKKGLMSFSPTEVGTLRIFSAGLFLLPLAFSHLKSINTRSEWLVIFIVGLCGSLIPALLFAKDPNAVEQFCDRHSECAYTADDPADRGFIFQEAGYEKEWPWADCRISGNCGAHHRQRGRRPGKNKP